MTGNEPSPFDRIKMVLRSIPWGQVMAYGEVARRAGFPRGARTVVWVLKSSAEKERLPWHRVVNKDLRIAIRDPLGHGLQQALLEAEGWKVDVGGKLTRP